MISKCTISLIYTCLLFLFMHCNLFSQWIHTNGMSNVGVFTLAASGNNVYAGSLNNGIYVSTNKGMDWTQSNSGIPAETPIRSFLVYGDRVYAGTSGKGVYISTNNGSSWIQSNSGLPDNPSVMSFILSGNSLFAAVVGSGVYLSIDNGANWTSTSTGLNNTDIRSLLYTGNNLFAATSGGVFISSNNGSNWALASSGLTNTDVWTLTLSGTNTFAGTHTGGVFYFSDSCSLWHQVIYGLPQNSIVQTLASSGIYIFAGVYCSGVYASENNGISWTGINTGLTNNDTRCLAVSDEYLYAGTIQGVYRRPLSDITSVNNEINSLPGSFSLEQNYPNPFNPATVIEYNLSEASHVNISVFDLLGRKINTLVNEALPAGKYSIQLNANNMVSGTYIYRLSAGNFVTAKKLQVLK